MPDGLLVTVPVLVPSTETVNLKVAEGTTADSCAAPDAMNKTGNVSKASSSAGRQSCLVFKCKGILPLRLWFQDWS